MYSAHHSLAHESISLQCGMRYCGHSMYGHRSKGERLYNTHPDPTTYAYLTLHDCVYIHFYNVSFSDLLPIGSSAFYLYLLIWDTKSHTHRVYIITSIITWERSAA